MPKKAKQARKKRISAREFTNEFTKIIGGHLANLPPAEQTKRLRAAERVVLAGFRTTSSLPRSLQA